MSASNKFCLCPNCVHLRIAGRVERRDYSAESQRAAILVVIGTLLGLLAMGVCR
jgi:hypothetical protein